MCLGVAVGRTVRPSFGPRLERPLGFATSFVASGCTTSTGSPVSLRSEALEAIAAMAVATAALGRWCFFTVGATTSGRFIFFNDAPCGARCTTSTIVGPSCAIAVSSNVLAIGPVSDGDGPRRRSSIAAIRCCIFTTAAGNGRFCAVALERTSRTGLAFRCEAPCT